MSKVHLLTENVANQIAAGEVVERPASVVKELVENALDAGAGRITVEVKTGGRSLIRVTDDGCGMNRDDALLSLERHATSKIQDARDLSAVTTMGFRGEALPSIGSVCRMTLTTQEKGTDDPATQIIINGGKLVDVRTAGAPSGTCVEVRSLFYNLPARRKFLRSEETEYGHIHHYLTLAALAHPTVAQTFIRDGRNIWQLPAVRAGTDAASQLTGLKERMRAMSGLDTKLIGVDYSKDYPPQAGLGAGWDSEEELPESKLRVWGMIGRPGVSRSTRQDQHLFVNRRPVQNRGLNMALLEGYHTALMKGQYPVCCLFIEIDPSHVDINIHPAKREVKFHSERVVRHLVAEAVREALLDFHGDTKTLNVEPSQPRGMQLHYDQITRQPSDLPSRPKPEGAETKEGAVQVYSTAWLNAPLKKTVDQPTEEPVVELPAETSVAADAESSVAAAAPASSSPEEAPPLLKVPLRLVGVIGKLYVVLESDRGLVLMDQHAAHERILFEQMLARLEKEGKAASQRLLLPETVELPLRDAQFLREQLETLNRLGVGLSEFGEQTFLLDALPPFFKAKEPRQFVIALVDELRASGDAVNTLRLGEHMIAKTVCRHAIKANDTLAEAELENLLEDLRRCRMPYTCPHGRPTLIELGYNELEKRFGRVT